MLSDICTYIMYTGSHFKSTSTPQMAGVIPLITSDPNERLRIDHLYNQLPHVERYKASSHNPNYGLYNYAKYKHSLGQLFNQDDLDAGAGQEQITHAAIKAAHAAGTRTFWGMHVNERGYVYNDCRHPYTLKMYAIQCQNLPGHYTIDGGMKFTPDQWQAHQKASSNFKLFSQSSVYGLMFTNNMSFVFPKWATNMLARQTAIDIFHATATPERLAIYKEKVIDGNTPVLCLAHGGGVMTITGTPTAPSDPNPFDTDEDDAWDDFMNFAATTIQKIFRGSRYLAVRSPDRHVGFKTRIWERHNHCYQGHNIRGWAVALGR